jgi:small acid-soluble spore protein D (minor alpha/beta-type SASP)
MQNLPALPTLSIHTIFDFGQTRTTETKMLSSGSIFFRRKQKERRIMSNSNNNQINVPQAREAMDRFKMQAAQEVGVNLTNGYNGHLTSREAGSVGGQMVKKMIEAYEQGLQ